MKRLLLAPLLLGLMPSANAGIYYYPFFNRGIEVRCLDNEPKHLISFKSGRGMKFEDYGDDKPKLWCTYHKANSRFKERQLLPLMVLDIDGKPFDWCRNLVQRLGAGEQLPNIPKGNGGQYLGSYLRRRSIKNIWLSICAEAEAQAQECTPYSFRHRYAYVAHTRPTEKGLYRSPNQIANSMGHDLNTHTVSYARFEISDLEEVFDLVEV